MQYQVVFDIAHTWPPLEFTAYGSVFILVGAMMVYDVRRRTTPVTRAGALGWFPYAFLAFAILWTSVATTATTGAWLANAHAVRSGSAEVVEGTVRHLLAMNSGSRSAEAFSVAGREFRYRDSSSTGAFAFPASRGGPVREGQHVRIHARRGEILVLEIAPAELVDYDPSPGVRRSSSRVTSWAPLLAVGWALLVVYALSFLSGWRTLAARYACDSFEPTEGHLLQTVRIGRFGGYRNAMHVGLNHKGMSLVPMLPFSAFQPMIVIPWSDVRSVVTRKEFLVSSRVLTLVHDSREIKFYGPLADAVERAFAASRA